MHTRTSIHVETFLFLVPFVAMMIAHKVLNLSNHFLAAPEPGKRDWLLYNLFMMFVFWTGVVGFYIHMTCHAPISAAWVVFKFLFLVGFCAAIFCSA